MKHKLLEKWESLSVPQKRKVVGIAFMVVALVFLSFAYRVKESRHQKVKTTGKAPYKLSHVDMVKETWFEKSQREIDDLKRQLEQTKKRQEALQKKLQRFQKQRGLIPGTEMGGKGVPVVNAKDIYPITPPPFSKAAGAEEKGFKSEPPKSSGSRFPSLPPPPVTVTKSKGRGRTPPRKLIGVIEETSKETGSTAPKKTSHEPEAKKEPPLSFYIPAGTFSTGMLLTGLDAPTGVKAKKSPHPTLIRLQDLSFLPNEMRENFSGCFVLGEGYGDLSAERAYVRLLNLSCVDTKDRRNPTVVDMKVKGYVVDTDGRIGLRGKVVTKQGAFLARALTAAFLDGIAQAFKQTTTSVSVSPEGTVATVDTDNLKEGLKVGLGGGFSEAASKLSDFYMDLAKETFPVVEIGARRHVTLVLTEGLKLTFDKALVIAKRPREEL